MTTIFQTRELVRDELAALFVTDGSWEAVYQYWPGTDLVISYSPILIIRSGGTAQDFAGVEINPSSYRFRFENYVKAADEDGSWTSANAEDEIDDLDRTIRQVIRNNISLTNANNLRFEAGYSAVRDVLVGGMPYIMETYSLLADLPKGST